MTSRPSPSSDNRLKRMKQYRSQNNKSLIREESVQQKKSRRNRELVWNLYLKLGLR